MSEMRPTAATRLWSRGAGAGSAQAMRGSATSGSSQRSASDVVMRPMLLDVNRVEFGRSRASLREGRRDGAAGDETLDIGGAEAGPLEDRARLAPQRDRRRRRDEAAVSDLDRRAEDGRRPQRGMLEPVE